MKHAPDEVKRSFLPEIASEFPSLPFDWKVCGFDSRMAIEGRPFLSHIFCDNSGLWVSKAADRPGNININLCLLRYQEAILPLHHWTEYLCHRSLALVRRSKDCKPCCAGFASPFSSRAACIAQEKRRQPALLINGVRSTCMAPSASQECLPCGWAYLSYCGT